MSSRVAVLRKTPSVLTSRRNFHKKVTRDTWLDFRELFDDEAKFEVQQSVRAPVQPSIACIAGRTSAKTVTKGYFGELQSARSEPKDAVVHSLLPHIDTRTRKCKQDHARADGVVSGTKATSTRNVHASPTRSTHKG